ncbi:MAG: hypothetical protein KKA84_09440 [Bacteroidetes bacterium]|nr:hypothetical protein [Bacteroidota bacterium]
MGASKLIKGILIILVVLFFCNNSINAQVSDKVSNVQLGEAKEGQALDFRVELQQGASISNITLLYKTFGQTEYKEKEMLISGSVGTLQIPATDISLPYIEYYFRIESRDGAVETYPLGVPNEGAPFQVAVSAISPKDKEVLILSPNKGELVTLGDLFISISLMKATDNINPIATKLYLDDIDVTPMAMFAGELIILYPENFPGTISTGAHKLRVDLYNNLGELYHTLSSDFQVVTSQFAEAVASKFKYSGNIQGESRNEQYDDEVNWYNNVTLNFNSTYSDWDIDAYGYVTSEEKAYLQPQNRYSVSAKSDWLELKVGDSYPQMPDLIMAGKRIRGVSGALKFGFFNIEAAYGQTRRGIEGNLIELIPSTSNTLESDIIAVDSVRYGQPYARVDLGTYSRQLFAIRPSFGARENFQLGFSYLHGKADTESIVLGAQPKENVVLGTDLFVGLDDQRITFTGEVAASLLNEDISIGDFTDAQIDSVFGSDSYFDADPGMIKDIKNYLGNFITVNQYLGPLNPQEFASMAAEAAINLNYFNNNLRASYIYRGNEFNSFGQSYLRTDVKGINLTDRIRMFDNKVFLSVGYEKLEDNLQETKIATTSYETINTSISIFPRADFPNITIGFTHYKNNNGLSITDPDNQNYAVDDATNKFTASLSYEIEVGVKHSTSLSFLTSTREDNSLFNIDANYMSTSLSVNSYWNSDFTSYFSAVIYTSEIAGIEYNYSSISLGGKYRMLENKLELNASISPSFGDFERQAFDFTGEYFIYENFSLMLQARLYRIPDQSTNSIFGLMTRIGL